MERNIYKIGKELFITSDEEIKEGDWFLNDMNILFKAGKNYIENPAKEVYIGHKKIILTTDQDLIGDSVQAIDDEFLEWFVKNPSCEQVEVELDYNSYKSGKSKSKCNKIIIPKEEPKQETLPELVNIIMMVSMDGKNWKRRNVIAVTNGTYVTSNDIKTDANTEEEFRSIDYWRFAKPI
jgi:hypothetical protein